MDFRTRPLSGSIPRPRRHPQSPELVRHCSTVRSGGSHESLCLEDYDPDGVLLADVYGRYAKVWKDLGATIVGGCCGISPSHIEKVVQVFKSP